MIQEIKINNFRSIIECSVKLNQLTVLVGANGTGKSNFIKSLQFLSMIPDSGIKNSIISFGGFRSLLPKKYPLKDHPTKNIVFEYSINLDPPDDYPNEFLPLQVNHYICFREDKKYEVCVTQEKLTFLNPFLVAYTLGNRDKIKDKTSFPDKYLNSKIEVIREEGKQDQYLIYPEPDKETYKMFIDWLGLNIFNDELFAKFDFEKFSDLIQNVIVNDSLSKNKKPKNYHRSLLEPSRIGLHRLSQHFLRYVKTLSDIKRYDFSQIELRKEQQIAINPSFTFDGRNMPSVLKRIKSSSNKISWNRILSTMMELNPFIESANIKQLQTGKEFIEFIENKCKNNVESWETSDGTLRSLAILLAVETHPSNSTIIIEEPEQNLHPWAVRSLVNHIRKVSEERKIQVILTTHSEQVLQCVRPEEVRFINRTIENGTTIKSLNDVFHKPNLQMGEVGRLWVKGLIGGVPAYEE